MTNRIPYENRKDDIRRVLIDSARKGSTITYGRLGDVLGIPARGPWKPILDELSREETRAGRPDITYLVVKASTGFPGQIKRADPLSIEQKELAIKTIGAVREYYKP